MKTHKIRINGCYSGMFETFQKEIEGKNKKKQIITAFIPHVPRNIIGCIVPLPVDQFTGKSFMKKQTALPNSFPDFLGN